MTLGGCCASSSGETVKRKLSLFIAKEAAGFGGIPHKATCHFQGPAAAREGEMIENVEEFVLIAIAKPGFGLNESDFRLVLRKLAATLSSIVLQQPSVQIMHFTSAGKEGDLIEAAKEISTMLNNMQVNVLLKRRFECPKKLIVFDMDSTLVQGEMIDQIATQSPKSSLIHHLTEKARNGEIEFKDAIIKRVELLNGMSLQVLEQVRQDMKLTQGGKEIIDFCQQVKGMKVALVSGGFTQFTDWLKETLGIDYAYSNLLEVHDGRLTGKVLGKIVDRAQKETISRALAAELEISMDNVVAVGDGANDLDMINAAGIGIAFNAKGIVQRNSPCILNADSLEYVKYFLG